MAQKTVVIIGGGHGGARAAARARQSNEAARIILIERSPHINWIQGNLRYHFSHHLPKLDDYLRDRDSYFQKRYGIEIKTATEVLVLDMDARCAVVTCDNHIERVAFDAAIVAGGSIGRELAVDHLSGPRVSHFKTIEDLTKIKTAIEQGAKTAVVVGCGRFGIDAVETLRRAGLSVSVVEKSPRICPRFSLPAATVMQNMLKQLGAQVLLSDQIVSAAPQENMGFVLTTAAGVTLDADLVVVTVGSKPHLPLLAEAGAAIGPDGAVQTDAFMETSLSRVFACGSAVSVPEVISCERRWLPQPAVIERTAQVAGHNAVIDDGAWRESLRPVAGAQMLRVGDTWFACTGLTVADARKRFNDDGIFSTTVHSQSTEKWFDGKNITVNLVVERRGGAIIGGEVWGTNGVSRRVDLITAAVLEGWGPHKLVDLDMAYEATLGPAFDPLKEAGALAKLALIEQSKTIAGEKLALWITQRRPFTMLDVSPNRPSVQRKILDDILHVPLEQLRDRLDELNRKQPIVVTSRSGRRAFLAQRVLLQRGFDEVYHLDGGLLTWSLMTSTPISASPVQES